jgi:hypothetical protein
MLLIAETLRALASDFDVAGAPFEGVTALAPVTPAPSNGTTQVELSEAECTALRERILDVIRPQISNPDTAGAAGDRVKVILAEAGVAKVSALNAASALTVLAKLNAAFPPVAASA